MEVRHEGSFALQVHVAAEPPRAFMEEADLLGLSDVIEFVPAKANLARLRSLLVRAANGRFRADVLLDVPAGRIIVRSTDPAAAEQVRSTFTTEDRALIDVEMVETMSQPTGGGSVAMTTCTAGFTVVKISTGNRGISTAGHCPDDQDYKGTSTTMMSEKYGGDNDFQWHDNANLTWDNTVHDGEPGGTTPYYRYIESREAASDIDVGDFQCKTGKETGYDCGTVGYVNMCPSYGPGDSELNCTFYLLEGEVSMAQGGDSGGPVFRNNRAIGTISGKYQYGSTPSQAIVMPQSRFANGDLRVAIN